MNIHENARVTVHGRALLVSRIRDQGWRVVDAAKAAGVSGARPTPGWPAIGPAALRR
jgi:hypothetical protein